MVNAQGKKIVIYADGSSLNNPGKGGYAALLLFFDGKNLLHEKMVSGCKKQASNNQMELQSLIHGLKSLKKDKAKKYKIDVFMDSMYVINGLTQWRESWEFRNFRGVKNIELWKELYELWDEYNDISIQHVKAHNGQVYNERVDKEAHSRASQCK